MSNHIFISYTREDARFSHHLAVDLEASGFNVWIDKALLGGDEWRKVIEDKVRTCQEMLVVLSPAALHSRWVQHEGSMAYTLGKRILPVLCQDLQEPLPVFAEQVQYLDFTRDYAAGLQALLQLLTPPNPFQDLLDYQLKIYQQHGELMSASILKVILEHEATLEIGPAARSLVDQSLAGKNHLSRRIGCRNKRRLREDLSTSWNRCASSGIVQCLCTPGIISTDIKIYPCLQGFHCTNKIT